MSYPVQLWTMSAKMSLQNVVILGYSTLWPAWPVLCTLVQYLIAFCSRLEAASDDSRLFDSLGSLTRFTHLCAVFNCILQPTGGSQWSHMMRFTVCLWEPNILEKCAKFHDSGLNRSWETQPKAVIRCGIFGCISNFDNCRLEVAGDVISGAALNYVSIDVLAKFGYSRLFDSLASLTCFTHFCAVFNCILQPTGGS